MKLLQKITCALLLAVASMASHAQRVWDLQGVKYRVDTLKHVVVGPGTTYTRLELVGEKNTQQLYISETDLTNPNVSVRAINGKNKAAGRSTVSEMVQRHNNSQRTTFLGVNADFFSYDDDMTFGAHIGDGEIHISQDRNPWKYFYIDEQNRPYISNMTQITGTITLVDTGKKITANSVNRSTGNVRILTDKWGQSTGTTTPGGEVILRPVGGQTLTIGRTVECEVVTPLANTKNTTIPTGCLAICSEDGTSLASLQDYNGKVQIRLSATLNTTKAITQMVGGSHVIVTAGKVDDYASQPETWGDRFIANPRTAVGYNKDKTRLVLIVCDGRSDISAGITNKQLANVLLELGCYTALNLDGGGSCTFYVNPLGLQNAVSDGSERPVYNALTLCSNTPVDKKITEIRFSDWRISGAEGDSYIPVIYGYNQYGVLVDTNVQGCTLSAPGEYALTSGQQLVLVKQGNFLLQAQLGDLSATVPVSCDGVSSGPRMNPYAYALSSTVGEDDVTFHYSLNTPCVAAELHLLAAGQVVQTLPLEGTQLYTGPHTVTLPVASLPAGQVTWEVQVTGAGVTEPTPIGNQYATYCTFGAAIDNNPESSHFGRAYFTEGIYTSSPSYISGEGRGNGLGVYCFDPQWRPIQASNGLMGFAGNAGFNSDASVRKGTYGYYDPKTIRIAQDGRVFVGRTAGVSSSGIWEVNPDDLDAPFTPIFLGEQGQDGITRTSDGQFMAGMAVSFFTEGAGDDLRLTVLSSDVNGNNLAGYNGFYCNRYDLGTATQWTTAPSSTVECLSGKYVPSPQTVSILDDGQGGMWLVQHRSKPSAQSPAIKHFRADGTEDYTDITSICRGGSIAISRDGLIAIPVDRSTMGIFRADYTTNPVTLTNLYQFATREGSNITAAAFDYAGNLYLASNDSETIGRYALPSVTGNVVTTPAASRYTITGTDVIQSVSAPTSQSVYNLSGQRVTGHYRGIVIRGGKKIII